MRRTIPAYCYSQMRVTDRYIHRYLCSCLQVCCCGSTVMCNNMLVKTACMINFLYKLLSPLFTYLGDDFQDVNHPIPFLESQTPHQIVSKSVQRFQREEVVSRQTDRQCYFCINNISMDRVLGMDERFERRIFGQEKKDRYLLVTIILGGQRKSSNNCSCSGGSENEFQTLLDYKPIPFLQLPATLVEVP